MLAYLSWQCICNITLPTGSVCTVSQNQIKIARRLFTFSSFLDSHLQWCLHDATTAVSLQCCEQPATIAVLVASCPTRSLSVCNKHWNEQSGDLASCLNDWRLTTIYISGCGWPTDRGKVGRCHAKYVSLLNNSQYEICPTCAYST